MGVSIAMRGTPIAGWLENPTKIWLMTWGTPMTQETSISRWLTWKNLWKIDQHSAEFKYYKSYGTAWFETMRMTVAPYQPTIIHWVWSAARCRSSFASGDAASSSTLWSKCFHGFPRFSVPCSMEFPWVLQYRNRTIVSLSILHRPLFFCLVPVPLIWRIS